MLLLCLVSTSQAFFDPNIGRWASRDPIEEEGGMHVYPVLGNNAVNLCDYLGLAPKLSYKTVDGPTGKDCGEFKWAIQWLLDAASTKGGYIVQNVAVTFDVKHRGGAPFNVKKVMGYDPAWWPLWELWPVNAGKDKTTYAGKGLASDDIYSFKNFGSCTYGTVTISGKAEFYDGLSLPSGFKVTKKPPTGILVLHGS